MKFCFENADALKVGIETLIPELGIVLADASEADVVVFVKETDEDIVTVTRDGRRAEIVYGGGKARFFRGLATLAGFVREL